MKTTGNMGLGFISRSLKTTGVVSLIFLPFGLYYLGFYPTLAIFSGTVWAMVNMMFITRLIKAAVRPEGPDKFKVAVLLFIKVPALYVAGYFLLTVPQFDPLYLVIGFTALLAVMVLKAVGKVLVENDNHEPTSGKLQKVI